MQRHREPDGTSPTVVIRPWRKGDEDGIDGLLSAGADPIWRAQFHSLHGADRHEPRWRRTLVATEGDQVVAAITVIASRVHPTRWPCALEVHPLWRRRGLATALLARFAEQHPHAHPLSSKIRPSDTAATSFLASAGGSAYQRCPGQVIDPRGAEVRGWVEEVRRETGSGVLSVTGLQDWDTDVVAEAFAAQYRWVHQDWAPVLDTPAADLALQEVSAAAAGEVDRTLSSVASDARGAVAFAFAFPAASEGSNAPNRVEVVAEASGRPQRSLDERAVSVSAVRACVARTLAMASATAAEEVELDGHLDDPHLQAAVGDLPLRGTRPLWLVEKNSG